MAISQLGAVVGTSAGPRRGGGKLPFLPVAAAAGVSVTGCAGPDALLVGFAVFAPLLVGVAVLAVLAILAASGAVHE